MSNKEAQKYNNAITWQYSYFSKSSLPSIKYLLSFAMFPTAYDHTVTLSNHLSFFFPSPLSRHKIIGFYSAPTVPDDMFLTYVY